MRCWSPVPQSSRPAPEPDQGPQETRAADPLNPSTDARRSPRSFPRRHRGRSRRPPARSPFATNCGSPGRAATTSAPAAGSASASPPPLASSSPRPNRPVVCVLGEGSAQYAITAFWSAVAYTTPVTFLVVRNEEYMILKWFAEVEQVSGAPGLDLPGLDVAAVGGGLWGPGTGVSGRERCRGAARGARRRDGPRAGPSPGGARGWAC